MKNEKSMKLRFLTCQYLPKGLLDSRGVQGRGLYKGDVVLLGVLHGLLGLNLALVAEIALNE